MMRAPFPFSFGARQRGVAAIELALLLAVTFLLLPATFLFMRVLMQYTTIRAATRDAAMYMATVAPVGLGDPSLLAGHEATARQMINDAAAAAGFGLVTRLSTALVRCDNIACFGNPPQLLTVDMAFAIDDNELSGFTSDWLDYGRTSLRIETHASMPYATTRDRP